MLALRDTPIGKDITQDFWIKGGRDRPYQKTRFELLPDDILIFIFSFYLDQAQDEEKWPGERTEEWHALVHVCRRWRSVVFASPRHLRLRLVCTERRSVKEMDNIWPALPIVIRTSNDTEEWVEEHTYNILTALNCNDRISEISFYDVPAAILKVFAAVMEEPFPLLTSLSMLSSQGIWLALPDLFLGGSAPRLRSLHLNCAKFPGLRTLLSSTSDLDRLSLWLVSSCGGYINISPDAMVSCLSAANRLKSLHLDIGQQNLFHVHRDREGPTRIVLPALTHFSWKGTSEYLNELLALIDAPQLYSMRMTFGHQLMSEAPQVPLFIGRTERFKGPYRANITAFSGSVVLILRLRTQTVHYPLLELAVNYQRSGPLSYLVRTCRLSCLPLSTVERLDIDSIRSQAQLGTDTEWLQLLDLFVSVKDLYVSRNLALRAVLALQDLSVGRATEVLPALDNLFIEGLESSGQEAVEQFAAMRQRVGHPVAVRPWTSFNVGTENLGRSTVVEYLL